MQTGEPRSRLPVVNQESCPVLFLSEPAGLLNPSHGTGHPHRCLESRFLVISEDTDSTALSKSAPLLCPLSPQLCKTRRSPSDEKGSKSPTIILFKLKAKAGLGTQASKPDTGAGDRGDGPTTHVVQRVHSKPWEGKVGSTEVVENVAQTDAYVLFH